MIKVVNSGASNLNSVLFALERMEVEYQITDSPEIILKANKVIFPGVGSAGAVMERLKAKEIDDALRNAEGHVLGICLGMQLLYDYLEEGSCEGFKIIPGFIKKLEPQSSLKVPHMGWNRLDHLLNDPMLQGIPQNACFYFVHSYYAPVSEFTVSRCKYGKNFSAIVKKDKFYGIQFHPEKSGEWGRLILRNFINL